MRPALPCPAHSAPPPLLARSPSPSPARPADAYYRVVDDGFIEYSAGAGNIVLCPDPPEDNPPTNVTLGQVGRRGDEGGGRAWGYFVTPSHGDRWGDMRASLA